MVREGAGRSVLGWGERDRLGEVPERTRPGQGRAPSLGPVAIKKACPLPPGLKSLRVHDARVSTEEAESDPSPDQGG